jgi:hypothetical protein
MAVQPAYPATLEIDYPDRQLDRVSSLFRIFTVIPIGIVLGLVSGQTWESSAGRYYVAGAGGLLFLAPLLMILFRLKYPKWWFDWNLELQRFGNRVGIYLALMDDQYPSTDEHQSVRLELPYPDAKQDLNRWLPLVKWLLAIPHLIVLLFLWIAAFFVVIFAWFAILFTGRYPRGLFDYVEGVIRWHNRVTAYALILVTDAYHMLRSERCFRKEGIDVVPAACAYRSFSKLHGMDLLPSWEAISWNEDILHESLGLLWYRIRSWI